MLFRSFKQQFDTPALFVSLGNFAGGGLQHVADNQKRRVLAAGMLDRNQPQTTSSQPVDFAAPRMFVGQFNDFVPEDVFVFTRTN